MKLTSPEIKNLIYQITSLEPSVDEGGKPTPRKTCPLKYQRGRNELRSKVANSVEVLLMPQGSKLEEVDASLFTWVKMNDYIPNEGREPVIRDGNLTQRITDNEIELSDKALEAFKVFLKEWQDDLPELTDDGLALVEKVLA